MKFSLIICLVLPLLANALDSQLLQEEWNNFKKLHGKYYRSAVEESYRFKVFSENLEFIMDHNQKHHDGSESSLKLGVNQFTDMTLQEFNDQMNGFRKGPGSASAKVHANVKNDSLPDQIDWTQKSGVVGPVKDQGQCGSCWAFSAVASIESQNALKTGKLVELSEQMLVDCSGTAGNMGCYGGLMIWAFDYIISNGGIDTEKSYPYQAIAGTCRKDDSDKVIGAKIKSYAIIPTNDEQALQQAVAEIGPISVAINASSKYFQLYKSGVFNDPQCSADGLNHGVAVVGYGTTNSGIQYYKVKNSWGKNWGMDGYILMSRNKNNQCGIATMASYPIL